MGRPFSLVCPAGQTYLEVQLLYRPFVLEMIDLEPKIDQIEDKVAQLTLLLRKRDTLRMARDARTHAELLQVISQIRLDPLLLQAKKYRFKDALGTIAAIRTWIDSSSSTTSEGE
uniref:Uncharacterized protein n=1 Tax=Magnetococcus massalia (strain MO-1) TaxID=451514 RepID=A0A1S7LJ39_MAGMO|nr:protein of unknown function [Candidatus Magnetococcus massalia]